MKLSKFLATLVFATTATLVQADLVSVTGGEVRTAPANNDFIAGEQYNIGGNVFATHDVHLTFTYLGHEAGFSNDFRALGHAVELNNKENHVGDSGSGFASAGLIDFEFFSRPIHKLVTNGNNQPFASPQSFATMLDFTWTDGVTYAAILFFDDSGANQDDNHDDHIIGITATKKVVDVPAPGALAIMGLGLLGLRLAQRRHS